MRRFIIIGLAVAGVSVASSSFAQNAPPPPPPSGGGGGVSFGSGGGFGSSHQLVISGDTSLGGYGAGANGAAGSYVGLMFASGGGTTISNFTLKPGADYFFMDNLSLGGFVDFSVSSGGAGGSVTTFGLGPRFGYDYNFNDQFSIWPKAGFSFLSIGGEGYFQLNIFAPFLFHVAPHFFVGLGPEVDIGLSGTPNYTIYGLNFTIGGWTGL